MDIGIRLHDMAPGTLEQRLATAHQQGFTCAHLALSKTIPDFKMSDSTVRLTPEWAKELHDLFASHDLSCVLLGCYMQLTDPNPESLAKTQECYRAHLRFGKQMGVTMVGTETPPAKGAVFSEPHTVSEDAFNLFIDALRPVVRAAEEEDMLMAIEPVASHVISTPERAARMLDAISSDHLVIILDAVNLLTVETASKADEIVKNAIHLLGDKVRLLHMKDYEIIPGEPMYRSIACGTGSMHYKELLRFGQARHLPMTLENTRPDNAEEARLLLERISKEL